MLRKILVANRGEIALRIIRACRELGLATVAVYERPDQTGRHVRMADEAVCLAEEPLGGYLSIEHLIDAARRTGCDGLHPGYGFLSENADLARACREAGITYIGPPAEVIAAMGDKTAARRTMQQAGIAVIPGTDQSVSGLEEALSLAEEIGYPVMLKATAGGGGRGIRRCNDATELHNHYRRASSEADKAFGNPEVFLEKYVEHSRHIEVQVLADHHGNVVHLFERDCSIQRRHQKLLEFAPSPQLSEEQRHRVGELGVRAARAAGYQNAGTVEFLLTPDGELYFMEMNTRLQVEHPVSELISGVDIVQAQLRIAAGEPLPWPQEQLTARGYALELRINAEDPQNGFLPSFGTVDHYLPAGGPGVRIDSALYSGYTIPPHYDSLCAKLIVHADNWPGLLARARRALQEMTIHGIRTTIPYYLALLEHESIQAGRFDTDFVGDNPQLADYSQGDAERVRNVATALAVLRLKGSI